MSAASFSSAASVTKTASASDNFVALWGAESTLPTLSTRGRLDTQAALKWMESLLARSNHPVKLLSHYPLTPFTQTTPLCGRIAQTAERVLLHLMEEHFSHAYSKPYLRDDRELLLRMADRVKGFTYFSMISVHDSAELVFGKEWWYCDATMLQYHPLEYLNNLGWSTVPLSLVQTNDVVLYFFDSKIHIPTPINPVKLFGGVLEVGPSSIKVESVIDGKVVFHSLERTLKEFGDSVMFLRKTKNTTSKEYVENTIKSIWGEDLPKYVPLENTAFTVGMAVSHLARHNDEARMIKEFPYYTPFLISPVDPVKTQLRQEYPRTLSTRIQDTAQRVLLNLLILIHREEEMNNSWKFLSHREIDGGVYLYPLLFTMKDYRNVSRAELRTSAFAYVFPHIIGLHNMVRTLIPYLLKRNWSQVLLSDCQKDDVVIYYKEEDSKMALADILPRHAGIVDSVKDGKVMVRSLNGGNPNYVVLHELTVQPEEHGNAFMILRHRAELTATKLTSKL